MTEAALHIKVVGTELPGTTFREPDGTVREPVYLGIQKGRSVVESVPADRSSVEFAPVFTIRKGRSGSLDFFGPFAQGKPGERFFYLSWGVRKSPGELEMFRRLKVSLSHLEPRDVEAAARSGTGMTVRIRLTDEQGAPLCATPPPGYIHWSSS